MINFIGTNITQELLIVYTLIGIVIFLIIAILVVDHFTHKRNDSLFDSKKLSKRLKKLQEMEEEEEYVETIEQEPVPEEVIPIPSLKIEESALFEEEEIYQEPEIEKTQAQIDIEEITKALKKAQEEETRVDPYAKFEEEQEQNAIISYDELQRKFDQLYDENEKIQYIDDDNLPIDIDELYKKNEEVLQPKKMVLEDMKTVKTVPESTGKFKSSPVISPVYGIQKETKKQYSQTSINEIDEEIRKTNEFLKNLKELKKKLD